MKKYNEPMFIEYFLFSLVISRLRCLVKWFMCRTCREHNLPRDGMFLQLRQQVSEADITICPRSLVHFNINSLYNNG